MQILKMYLIVNKVDNCCQNPTNYLFFNNITRDVESKFDKILNDK